MSSFLTFIASPAVQQVAKKPIFGKPYTTLGSLYGVIGFWVYQLGGVLGYCLRDTPNLLVKLTERAEVLLAINTKALIKGIKESASIVESGLKELEGEEKTFFHLYTLRQLRSIGIDFTRLPPDKRLNDKVDAESAGGVMRTAFALGIGFGFNFPEEFAVYWDNTYRIRPDSEWQKWYERGIVRSKTQRKQTLKEAIAELAEGAMTWDRGQSPRMLDTNDIRVLQGIIEANR